MIFNIVHTCNSCLKTVPFISTNDREVAVSNFNIYIEILNDTPRAEWKRCCGKIMRLQLVEIIETY